MLKLYKATVRTQLKCCIVFGSTHFKKDAWVLGSVQKILTRLIPEMGNLTESYCYSVGGGVDGERTTATNNNNGMMWRCRRWTGMGTVRYLTTPG